MSDAAKECIARNSEAKAQRPSHVSGMRHTDVPTHDFMIGVETGQGNGEAR